MQDTNLLQSRWQILGQCYGFAWQQYAGFLVFFTLLLIIIYLSAAILLQQDINKDLAHYEPGQIIKKTDIRAIELIIHSVLLLVIRIVFIYLKKRIFMICSHLTMLSVFIYSISFQNIDSDSLDNIFRAGLGLYVPLVALSIDIIFLYETFRLYYAKSRER